MRSSSQAVVLFTFVVALFSAAGYGNGAKILGIFPFPAPSHLILGNRIMNELAAKGHEVTFITPLPQKQVPPGLKEIHITKPLEYMQEMKKRNMFEMVYDNAFFSIYFISSFSYDMTRLTFEDEKVQQLLQSKEKFDLVLLENFNNDAFYGFAHRFNCPLVLFSTIGASVWVNPVVRNPSPPSYVPDMMLDFTPQMNFKERVYNTIFLIYQTLYYDLYTYPKHNSLLHEFFPEAPALSNLKYNTSLILLNSHVSINAPVPHVPAMVEIGGFHVQPPKKLPKDLQDYLDSAKDGVIYFSMGSNLKSVEMPEAKREAILKVFSKLKQKVLWKWEDDNLPGKPANVRTGKWLPQQDILAHPNVKVFITHGGLLSTTEAIYHGVPLVGIPIFGDQKMNVAGAARNGFAVSVPFSVLGEQTLEYALNEVLNNPKYALNAKTRSKIMHDQPVKPLDSAIFWVEYVLRHNGAYHFRTSAMDLYWFEYLMVDVVLFLIADAIVVMIVFYLICAKCCCGKKTKSDGKSKAASEKKKKN